ncbi:MAG: hypothetical protein KF819_01730 [Labilithrix sp.]|nr:hypothetical protein [Labilithrix sp.]
MNRSWMTKALGPSLVACGIAFTGCADGDATEADDDDSHASESNLTNAEKEAVCNAIPAPRPWTAEEHARLAAEVVRRFVDLKKKNDALIARRGVGAYAGARTEIWKAISLRNDRAAAAAMIKPKLKPGFDERVVAAEMQGTSCIGRVYEVLREVYEGLGRGAEWKAVEKCGRAWDSDGLHVQQALIKNGWPAPTLALVTDEARAPGSEAEKAVHAGFMRSVARGAYYGTPVSRTSMMKNFMPTPGSSTRLDESTLLAVGGAKFLGVGTLRGAYHVPFVVPAAMIPEDVAPEGAARAAWLAARRRGEPFILESHSLRQPWDATNFEIRPLKEAIAETMSQSVVYSTGTLLFSPGSSWIPR